MTICKNAYLSKSEMAVNAQYILDYLMQRGWSKESVCGMLGNMETESNINPCIWEDLNSGNKSGGFGLVQWTPSTKYTEWAVANGYSPTDIDGQLNRLQYEIDNGLQWITKQTYPISFQAFKVNSAGYSVEQLAQAFLLNYERPEDQTQPARSTQARYWYDTLTGSSGGGQKPFFPTTEGLNITSKYGWRDHPITGELDFHAAIDISGGGVNHPVYATQTGIVIENGFNSSMGNFLRIQHTGDPYFSQYLHLAYPSSFGVGSQVYRGQEIATMGTTGSSTGIHLDFAIAIDNNSWFGENGTIDPELYLEMTFGETDNRDNLHSNLIHLFLCGALRNWS